MAKYLRISLLALACVAAACSSSDEVAIESENQETEETSDSPSEVADFSEFTTTLSPLAPNSVLGSSTDTTTPPTNSDTSSSTSAANQTTAEPKPNQTSATTSSPNTNTTSRPATSNSTTRPAQTVATTSRPATTQIPAPPGGNGARRPYGLGAVNWTQVETDDFNGTRLDDTKFEYGWYKVKDDNGWHRSVNGNETACYHTDQVKVSGGTVALEMRTLTSQEKAAGVCRIKNGSASNFVTGYLTTRDRISIRPGSYIETRMFLPGEGTQLYNWPAFWSTDMQQADWPRTGEFDIAEILGGKACANYHYGSPSNGSHQQTGKRCTTLQANQWHVIGMKWNYNGTVEFYHNGKRVQDRNGGGNWLLNTVDLAGPIARQYEHDIAFQFALGNRDNTFYKEPTPGNPLVMKYDYLDVYKL